MFFIIYYYLLLPDVRMWIFSYSFADKRNPKYDRNGQLASGLSGQYLHAVSSVNMKRTGKIWFTNKKKRITTFLFLNARVQRLRNRFYAIDLFIDRKFFQRSISISACQFYLVGDGRVSVGDDSTSSLTIYGFISYVTHQNLELMYSTGRIKKLMSEKSSVPKRNLFIHSYTRFKGTP